MKTTSERILDAAEDLFAAKGYHATSLGEVADQVGIRSPSLYNHFRNKEALYAAVVDRLLVTFNRPFDALVRDPLTKERILDWQGQLVRMHIENPNLARLVQHEALSGGPQSSNLIESLFRPLFERSLSVADEDAWLIRENPQLTPWVVMGFNNLVMSYVTMSPMYRDMLGVDPLSSEAAEFQVQFMSMLTQCFWESDYRALGGDGIDAANAAKAGGS